MDVTKNSSLPHALVIYGLGGVRKTQLALRFVKDHRDRYGRIRLLTAEQFLNTFPIKTVYAPSLKRTTETADIMSSGILTHPPVVVADDAKTWNFGVLAGTIKKENKPLIEHFMLHTHDAPDGGESRDAFRARFLPWLHREWRT